MSMADKLSTPAVDFNEANNSHAQNTSPKTPTITSRPSTTSGPPCSCTKISTMQMFYEMKQKFPTVPDNVVCEYVGLNCHNRSACIDGLRSEDYPGSVNAYPQALRNQPNKKQQAPRQPATTTTIISNSSSQSDGVQMGAIADRQIQPKLADNLITLCENSNESDENNLQTEPSTSDTSNKHPKNLSQRPNTLNLTNLDALTGRRSSNRPTRIAPPPPTASATSTHKLSPSAVKQPLNLSLNVIVSPVSTVRPPARPPRSAQQAVISNASASASEENNNQNQHFHSTAPRNFTSLSFTLHQPTSSNVSASNSEPFAATTATSSGAGNSSGSASTKTKGGAEGSSGPSLKYTSSAYDAEMGYQSRLEITVAGTNQSSTDASSNSPHNHQKPLNSCFSLPVIYSSSGETRNVGAPILSTNPSSLPSVVASSEFLEETDTVHHQMLCKQRLVIELEKDRKRLERMQRELRAIQAPVPEGGIQTLAEEIEKLRQNCRQMAQEVEEAGPSYALGETNEVFYKNIYTGQRLPIQQRQSTIRPHRPAPPPIPAALRRNLSRSSTSSINAPTVSLSPSSPLPSPPSTSAYNPQPQSQQSTSSNSAGGADNDLQENGWTCNLCTFQNKYTHRTCELCAMPLLSAGNSVAYPYSDPFLQMTSPISPPQYLPVSTVQPSPYQQYNLPPPAHFIYQPQQQHAQQLQLQQQPLTTPLQQPQYFQGYPYQAPSTTPYHFSRQAVSPVVAVGAVAANNNNNNRLPPINVPYGTPVPYPPSHPRLTQQH